jgi:hypothetical protein
MLFDPKHEIALDRLANELRLAQAPSCDLFCRIVSGACTRLPLLRAAGKTVRLDRLIEDGAWTDAALALIELEVPAWKLRRLAYEHGEWISSLSRQPNLPVQFDDTADAGHPIMALAILGAFIEARHRTEAEKKGLPGTVPQVRSAAGTAICCDNFA